MASRSAASKTGIRHTVMNCVAWKNKANGFYANHSSGWKHLVQTYVVPEWHSVQHCWRVTWSEPNGGGTRTDGVILDRDEGAHHEEQTSLSNKNEYITGLRGRHGIQHLGSEYHASSQGFPQHHGCDRCRVRVRP